MVSLCKDKNLILSSVDNMTTSEYINGYIRLYLESYGTDYNFQEFYLQFSEEDSSVTAVIHRYNNQVYVTLSGNAEREELCAFLMGFSECTVVADKTLSVFFSDYDECCIMSKSGVDCCNHDCSISLCYNTDSISKLVGESMSPSERIDYFLNLSHQMRHNIVSAYGYFVDQNIASVAMLSAISLDSYIITTVYTKVHFRGNGYAKKILDHICYDSFSKYVLLCEKHNVKFYEKCGFLVVDTCIRFRL